MLSKSGCPLQRQSWPSCDAAGAQGSCAHGCWRRVTCKFHSALESDVQPSIMACALCARAFPQCSQVQKLARHSVNLA